MRNRILLFVSVCIFLISTGHAQAPAKYSITEIQQMLKKLNVLGSVLYVAAHPDDENTSMIAYYANEEMMRTAYFSATRGDGGQNLIGTEMSELLGLIRTQELLAARRIDGGEQFFSRANDFGFSKDPTETFNIWDNKTVLSDLVLTIRKFRPDIIITRFSLEPGITHGHHTASAMLANEAFDIAGNSNSFPEHFSIAQPWQPKRIFWNTSWWFYQNTGRRMDTSDLLKVNVGAYSPIIGKSYTEISALSRSMHKSQGFGATGNRGEQIDYLAQWKGEKASENPLEGINTTWSRVEDGNMVAIHTQKAKENFDPSNPHTIIPHLIEAYKATANLKDEHWKKLKQDEIKTLIKACSGLFLEVKSNTNATVAGDSLILTVEAINRSSFPITLNSFGIINITSNPMVVNKALNNNEQFTFEWLTTSNPNTTISQPYWLREKGSIGMYKVEDINLIGKPENDPAFEANFELTIEDTKLSYNVPVVFKRNDQVNGETYEPFIVTPPVYANISEKVFVLSQSEPRQVRVKVTAAKDDIDGSLSLQLPDGWSYAPNSIPFDIALKDQEKEITFTITPPKNQSEGELRAIVTVDDKVFSNSLTTIDYSHIPKQRLFSDASARLVNIDLKTAGSNIGYIMGAGDEIPVSLRQIGYKVTELKDEDITDKLLAGFDAIVLGVRAYNTLPRLAQHQQKLLKYVENGGTMVVQYNTTRPLLVENIGPYPLSLSRDRVTVEDAEVTILAKDHPIMNFPNKITKSDFDGWVQERGLYFPDQWDDKYIAILSCNDPGESPKNGGLLVAKYGKGNFVYTGYSWFRELPAGVPGAYRIFANMVSLGQYKK